MTKLKFLAAAAVVASLAASPVMAKDSPQRADRQTVKPQKPAKQARAQTRTWRNDRAADVRYGRGFAPHADFAAAAPAYDNRGYGYNDGFWPADVAANVATDAVITAGAIASAPFRDNHPYDRAYDDSYAYSPAPAPVYRSNWDNGWNTTSWNDNWNSNWARRQSVEQGGFVCTPGSYYTNSYGYTQLCQ